MAKGTCSVIEDGVPCPDPHSGRGYCSRHYQAWRTHGDPLGGQRHFSWPENVLRNLHVMPPTTMETGCIELHIGDNGLGYPRVSKDGEPVYAYRAVWEWLVGPIPDGYELDHLCRNPPCLNLGHLEPVPKAVNILRGFSPPAKHARKTHCIHGHEFTPENTYTPPGTTHRQCRTCNKDREAKRQRRRSRP